MGKILNASIAIMVTFMFAGLLALGVETQSTDANETTFVRYNSSFDNQTGKYLTAGNVTYQQTEDTIFNFQTIVGNMQTQIATSQTQLTSGNYLDMILGAFGLITSLAMNTIFLLLAVAIEGVNLIGGIVVNANGLPSPYNLIAYFLTFCLALFMVYFIFRMINVYKGSEPI